MHMPLEYCHARAENQWDHEEMLGKGPSKFDSYLPPSIAASASGQRIMIQQKGYS